MKSMKKVLSLVLTFVMLLSLAITANAADASNKITITNDKEGHTYEAYQIFKGDLSGGVLSNVEWGNGVTLGKDATLQVTWNDGTAQDKTLTAAGWAEELGKVETDSALAKAFADAVSKVLKADAAKTTSVKGATGYVIDNLEAGYYLVKDKDKTVSGQDAYTSFILKVVGEATASPKSDVPSVGKEVLDNNDSNSADPTNKWGKTADHDIGDDVSFRLTGTLPSNYDDYNSYKYIFHDKMSEGLTLNESSITVKAVKDGEETEITLKKDQDYTVVTAPETGDGCAFHVVFKNLKSIAGITKDHKIVVEYTATLNDKAVIGNPGNPNEVKLQFSNDPNWKGSGQPNDDEDEPTGETPWDKVIVFTFELDVDKVKDSVDGEALPGAGFTLYKKNADNDEYEVVKFTKKDDGKYYVDPNGNVTELTGEDLTHFQFVGLDDGDYKLSETKTPPKYNTIEDIEFTITAKHDETNGVTELTFKPKNGNAWTSSTDTGIGETKVVNKTGSTLPETGGIGTTIFYVVGGILVVFAGVLLITKRRMRSRD